MSALPMEINTESQARQVNMPKIVIGIVPAVVEGSL